MSRTETQNQTGVSPLLRIEKYSFGVGDRFAHQGQAQLKACMLAAEDGIQVVPVWNKSNREHGIVGSEPGSVRAAAESAVRELNWRHPFHIDADHINLSNVDRFVEASDFFTIDVADSIGKPSAQSEIDAFAKHHAELLKPVELSSGESIRLNDETLRRIGAKYLAATQEAGRIYRHIENRKGAGTFITEVSMDETDSPQTPEELLVILAALADQQIPLQTIAPKFTGRFNKGVDYVGDVAQFEREFRSDLAVIDLAIRQYRFPAELKLSVHSGSDKFAIYPAIKHALQDTGSGVHVKTAGTTWLEEVIGMAESGGGGLKMAKEIYASALDHRQELCAPYAAVIDIDVSMLPSSAEVNGWSSEQYVAALRHDQGCRDYNPSFRQLLHVGYKIAANMGRRYLDMLEECRDAIARNVTENLYERHLRRIFPPIRN